MPERLPVLPNTAAKLGAGLVVAALCTALYLLPAQWTLQRAGSLPLADWEQAIPYLPLSVWPYLMQYPLLLVAYLGTRDLVQCTRFLLAVLVVQAVAALCFMAWPLRYPRALHVAPPDTDAWTLALAEVVRAADQPVNCCPSLHVTSCLLCMALVGWQSPARSAFVGLVGVASMASTLTFKQHYAIDLLAGAVLAGWAWWWAGRRIMGSPARQRPAASAAINAGCTLRPPP